MFQLLFSNKDTKMKMTSLVGLIVVSVFSLCFIASSEATSVVGQEKGNNGVGGGQEKRNNGVGGGQEKGNNGKNDDATPAPEFEEAAFDSKFMFISTVFCFLYSRF